MAEITVGQDFEVSDPTTWLPTVWDLGMKAVAGSPENQIVASIIIATVAIATSYLSLGATLVVAIPAIIFAMIGFARLALSWVV